MSANTEKTETIEEVVETKSTKKGEVAVFCNNKKLNKKGK